MIKIFIAIGAVATLILAIGKRYLSRRAKKERLLVRIRSLENEMYINDVGSDRYNQLDTKLRQLNQEHADICRNE